MTVDNRSTEQGWARGAIAHLDLDAFFAAVEQLDNPELRGVPVIVGGDPTGRSVVSTASYEARVFGVGSAMPASRARDLCPDAVWVRPRFERYHELSGAVMDLIRARTPHVLVRSIDEAYFDLTPGRFVDTDPVSVLEDILADIDAMGLSASAGLSTSPVVSKIASDYRKPRGLTVVTPGSEAAFLSPLPVERLPGVGRVLGEKLRAEHFTTIGQLAALDPADAESRWGRTAGELVLAARGARPAGWTTDSEAVKSVSNERTFPTDVAFGEPLERELRALAERVAWRLRRQGLRGRTVGIKLTYEWGHNQTVNRTLAEATDDEHVIAAVAVELARDITGAPERVRLAGVRVAGFDGPDAPDTLFDGLDDAGDGGPGSGRGVDTGGEAAAIDAIRDKFGYGAIVRGASLRSTTRRREE